MSFITGFEESTGKVTKLSPGENSVLEFPRTHNGITILIIGTGASQYDNNIKELNFSQTLITKIEYRAFLDDINIEKITLPPTVVTLALDAFRSTKISEIKIPSSVVTFSGAFNMCSNLNYIDVDENYRFVSEPEGVYTKDYTTLIRAYGNVTYESITHFSTITSFGNYAFSKTNLERFTCTSKISEISNGLFESCSNLYELDLILSPATSIEMYCFKDCINLKTVILPYGIQVIKTKAFMTCSISSVFIPSSLREVGESAFYGQSDLTRIYYFGLENFEVDAFKGTAIDPII